MNQDREQEILVKDFGKNVKDYYRYLVSKLVWIIIIAIVFGVLGVLYAWYQKPEYKAELTFAPVSDNGGGMGAYSGLASQLGIDLGVAGGVFEGENLIQLLKSRLLIERTFLSPVDENNKELLINYLIKTRKMDKGLSKDSLNKLYFSADYKPGVRGKDSIMKNLCIGMAGALNIQKVDRRLDIVSVDLVDNDEVFAKSFVEQLVNNVIQYYTDYKSKKSRQNVEILQRKTDSVRSLISGSITSIAVSSDLNVNPAKQIMRAGTQRKQVDVQVNSALYGELLKNLELSKLNLQRETPIIQIIDTPMYPLEKKKLGRLKGGIIFAFIGGFLAFVFFFVRRMLKPTTAVV